MEGLMEVEVSLGQGCVGVPVANSIALRIAGSQAEPLCRLLGFWERLLTAPQNYFGIRKKCAFIFAQDQTAVLLKYWGVQEKEEG